MASIQERRDKNGNLISYSIRVFRGRGSDGVQLKPWIATFEVEPTWTEKSAKKKAAAFAATFEKECKAGLRTDCRQTFEQYCSYVIELKERNGVKHTTITGYKAMAKRIYPEIGGIRVNELRADHLNTLYAKLSAEGQNMRTGGKLTAKSIHRFHELISAVLAQAEKEGIVPFNVARKASPPKMKHKEVQYFEPEEIERIRAALEDEPIKWKTMTHLFLISGARRGEILGLKWHEVDFEHNSIHICNNVLYRPDVGIYEDTPKTETSVRNITLPAETMQLLRSYRLWQNAERLRLGAYYKNRDFVFAQDTGAPMHPDSVNKWLARFAERHDLPPIHPHAFRHTMASLLYFNGMDSVSISKRLGHAQISTTANIYAHVLKEADQRNADILEAVILKKA